MNLQNLQSKTKILFLLVSVFLYITLGTLIAAIATHGKVRLLFLVLTLWFGTATSLMFHYLLWKNLDFLHNVTINSNFVFMLIMICYVVLFPLISLLTLVFLIIFTIVILIVIINYHVKTKNNKKVNSSQT